jgi:hypothetical protein
MVGLCFAQDFECVKTLLSYVVLCGEKSYDGPKYVKGCFLICLIIPGFRN